MQWLILMCIVGVVMLYYCKGRCRLAEGPAKREGLTRAATVCSTLGDPFSVPEAKRAANWVLQELKEKDGNLHAWNPRCVDGEKARGASDCSHVPSHIVYCGGVVRDGDALRFLLLKAARDASRILGMQPRLEQLYATAAYFLNYKLFSMGTGEGKSLTLGLIIHVLVQLGKSVQCCTSNSILSERDYEFLSPLLREAGGDVYCFGEDNKDEVLSGDELFAPSNQSRDKKPTVVFSMQQKLMQLALTSSVAVITAAHAAAVRLENGEMEKYHAKRGHDALQKDKPCVLLLDEVDQAIIDSCTSRLQVQRFTAGTEELLRCAALGAMCAKRTLSGMQSTDEEGWDSSSHAARCDYLACVKTMLEECKKVGGGLSKRNEEIFERTCCGYAESTVTLPLDFGMNYNYTSTGTYGRGLVPVDVESGMIRSNEVFSNGRDAMLSMLNGEPVYAENYASRCISPMTFMSAFYSEIGGCSGTLGSEACRDFMTEMVATCSGLKTRCVDIPSMRESKRITKDVGVYQSSEAFMMVVKDRIVGSVFRVTAHDDVEAAGAAVVLFPCMRTAKSFAAFVKTFITEERPGRLHIVVRSDKDEFPAELCAGDVVVSTMLCHRGVDPKASAGVMAAGGITLIDTFLSSSSRFDEQKQGRVGRNGNPGKVEVVLQASPVYFGDDTTIEEARSIRDFTDAFHLAWRQHYELQSMAGFDAKCLEVQKAVLETVAEWRQDEAFDLWSFLSSALAELGVRAVYYPQLLCESMRGWLRRNELSLNVAPGFPSNAKALGDTVDRLYNRHCNATMIGIFHRLHASGRLTTSDADTQSFLALDDRFFAALSCELTIPVVVIALDDERFDASATCGDAWSEVECGVRAKVHYCPTCVDQDAPPLFLLRLYGGDELQVTGELPSLLRDQTSVPFVPCFFHSLYGRCSDPTSCQRTPGPPPSFVRAAYGVLQQVEVPNSRDAKGCEKRFHLASVLRRALAAQSARGGNCTRRCRVESIIAEDRIRCFVDWLRPGLRSLGVVHSSSMYCRPPIHHFITSLRQMKDSLATSPTSFLFSLSSVERSLTDLMAEAKASKVQFPRLAAQADLVLYTGLLSLAPTVDRKNRCKVNKEIVKVLSGIDHSGLKAISEPWTCLQMVTRGCLLSGEEVAQETPFETQIAWTCMSLNLVEDSLQASLKKIKEEGDTESDSLYVSALQIHQATSVVVSHSRPDLQREMALRLCAVRIDICVDQRRSLCTTLTYAALGFIRLAVGSLLVFSGVGFLSSIGMSTLFSSYDDFKKALCSTHFEGMSAYMSKTGKDLMIAVTTAAVRHFWPTRWGGRIIEPHAPSKLLSLDTAVEYALSKISSSAADKVVGHAVEHLLPCCLSETEENVIARLLLLGRVEELVSSVKPSDEGWKEWAVDVLKSTVSGIPIPKGRTITESGAAALSAVQLYQQNTWTTFKCEIQNRKVRLEAEGFPVTSVCETEETLRETHTRLAMIGFPHEQGQQVFNAAEAKKLLEANGYMSPGLCRPPAGRSAPTLAELQDTFPEDEWKLRSTAARSVNGGVVWCGAHRSNTLRNLDKFFGFYYNAYSKKAIEQIVAMPRRQLQATIRKVVADATRSMINEYVTKYVMEKVAELKGGNRPSAGTKPKLTDGAMKTADAGVPVKQNYGLKLIGKSMNVRGLYGDLSFPLMPVDSLCHTFLYDGSASEPSSNWQEAVGSELRVIAEEVLLMDDLTCAISSCLVDETIPLSVFLPASGSSREVAGIDDDSGILPRVEHPTELNGADGPAPLCEDTAVIPSSPTAVCERVKERLVRAKDNVIWAASRSCYYALNVLTYELYQIPISHNLSISVTPMLLASIVPGVCPLIQVCRGVQMGYLCNYVSWSLVRRQAAKSLCNFTTDLLKTELYAWCYEMVGGDKQTVYDIYKVRKFVKDVIQTPSSLRNATTIMQTKKLDLRKKGAKEVAGIKGLKQGGSNTKLHNEHSSQPLPGYEVPPDGTALDAISKTAVKQTGGKVLAAPKRDRISHPSNSKPAETSDDDR